jgi:hypothetical protein
MDLAKKQQALELRAKGWGWDMIADAVGAGRHAVRYNCDPAYREKHLANAKKYSGSRTYDNAAPGLSASKVIVQRAAPVVPRDVLFERERAMSAPPRPFGDPPPGRSALDKLNQRTVQ